MIRTIVEYIRYDKALALLIAALVAVVALLFVVAAVSPANAQVVDMRPATITVIEYAGGLLATVLSALGAWGIRYVNARTALVNSQTEADYAARLNDIIHRGIDYAVTAMTNEVAKPGSGVSEVRFDNYFMSLAASYINRSAPSLLSRFAISNDRLFEMIAARLPGYAGAVPITGGSAPTSTVTAVARAGVTQASQLPAVATPDTGS